MILYNIHTCGAGYMIGKFDEDINVLGTYLLEQDTEHALICDCPSWPRKQTCKHIDMLLTFMAEGKIDSDEFYDPVTGSWHRPLAYPALDNEELAQVIDEEDEEAIAELEQAFAAEPTIPSQPHPAFGPIKRRF